MLWFDGSVSDAVDKVKSSGVFLLVFVQGEDSLSKQYESYLNEETRFQSDEFVAIKIPHNSTAFQQFKQIYISVQVPSIFLIQNNGIPLEIITSHKVSDIYYAITEAINKQKIKKKQKNILQCNEEALSQSVCENEKVTSKPAQVKNTDPKLIDESREELRKRLSEYRDFPKFILIDTRDPSPPSRLPPKIQSARLQFRLPNNTMPSWEFPDLSTLSDVRAFLMKEIKLSSNFKLLRTYPRTAFTSEDENKTLVSLSLTPTATLMVIPVEDKTVQARVTELLVHESFLSNVLSMLLKPLFSIINFFKRHVFNMNDNGNNDEEPVRRLPGDTEIKKIYNKKTTSNIRGFKFQNDHEKDEKYPDNGNSTQQKYQD